MKSGLVTAPGKIILCGEYAVLRDAPAIVMAVDRRASVSVTPHDDPWGTINTPGYLEGAWRFELADDGSIRWLDELPSAGLRLPEIVLSQRSAGSIAPAMITIDTRSFSEAGTKFGLGSSAAATVALTAAIADKQSDTAEIWRRARSAHATLQNGSGADIAASCFGGLLSYRQGDETPPESMQWPSSIDFKVFFSGVAASTAAAVEKAGRMTGSESAWADLVSAAEHAARAWQASGADHILSSMRDYSHQLRDFDVATDTGIFSAGHDELHNTGESLGVVYKPCGAGGGDCGIALSDDVERLEEFSKAAISSGFVPLDVARDNRGL